MLPAKNKLPSPITKLNGIPASTKHLTLIFTPNQVGYLRARVIISKKITKHAVMRNHYRRQLYTQLDNSLNRNAGLDIVVIVHRLTSLKQLSSECRSLIAVIK